MISTTEQTSPAYLALSDGKIFRGVSKGGEGVASGEVVFNTSLTGYQETITDPSYANQLLTFTYPHIGNVGVNSEDVESSRIQVSGLIVKELASHYSNFRAEQSFGKYLADNNIVGIAGIDTRSLVIHLRTHGSQMGVIASGERNTDELVDMARSLPSIEGANLVEGVTTKENYDWKQGVWELGSGFRSYTSDELAERPLVVVLDLGVKFNILRLLVDSGFRVKVVPAWLRSEDILDLSPDAIFLSNGPGDPAAVTSAITCTKELIGKKPLFGICLGHQILGLALGLKTFKLKFGHRGGNHPVRDERSGKVEITVQNHGFASERDNIPSSVNITHINLNDETVEGFEVPDANAFSVQYHPESSPGPRDATHLFRQFRDMVGK